MDKVKELAKMIDHSLLHPTMTDEDLRAECEIAKKYEVASVCIKPYAVKFAHQYLQNTEILVGTVVSFPQGNSTIDLKVQETVQGIQDGAQEVDVVVNIGKVLSQAWEYIEKEIKTLREVTNDNNAILKLIFENDFLPKDDYKIKLCEICNKYKVDYVKTSTGYGMVKGPDGKYSYAGATDHDLQLMVKYSAPEVQVKAAGGVRTLDDLLRVQSLGVTRVGATATARILQAAQKRFH